MVTCAEKISLDRGLTPYYEGRDELQPYQEGLPLPLEFVVVHGVCFGSAYLEPLAARLKTQGHKIIIPELEYSDENKTFNDDAYVVKQAIKQTKQSVLVGHSRGIETVPRALSMLAEENELHRVKSVVIMNAAGPHGFHLPPEDPMSQQTRYTKTFRQGVKAKNHGRSFEFKPRIARQVFGNKLKDKKLLDYMIGHMQRQRTAEISDTPLPPMPKGLPAFVIQGKEDLAINLPRANHIMKKWLGKKTMILEIEDGGHMLPIEQPDNIAKHLVQLAVISHILNTVKDSGVSY